MIKNMIILYDFINEYKNEQDSMTPDDFVKFLEQKLETNIGLSGESERS